MKKIILVTAALFISTGLLVGCSSKPEASDVSGLLAEYWAPCKLVKATHVTKTNGLDRGATYQMSISYKLELTRDISVEDFWGPERTYSTSSEKFWEANCPAPANAYLAGLVAGIQSHYRQPFKKGEVIEVSAEYTMVKSENGWLIQ